MSHTHLNNARSRPANAGFSVFIVMLMIMSMILVMSAALLVTKGVFTMTQTVDIVRQASIEKRALAETVARSIQARIGTAAANATATLDSIIDAQLARMNAGAFGVTYARSAASPALPANRMFPDPARGAVTVPNFTTNPVKFQFASLMKDGAFEMTAGTPLTWTFTRTGSVSAENQTITVSARLWSVPISNFSLIGYGLPAKVSNGAGIPAKTPTNADTVLSSTAFTGGNGRGLLVTTLRPAPTYSNGDTTAFDTLYIAPASGQSERLPRYYIAPAAFGWDTWEYTWGQSNIMTLVSSAGSNTFDFDAGSHPSVPGVTINSANSITIDLKNVSGSLITVLDAAGGRTVNVTGSVAASGSALVVLVRNTSGFISNINLSGTNRRTTALYAVNNSVNFTGSASFNGAIFLDEVSTMTGTGSVQGMIAFYAPSGYPATASVTLTPASGSIKTDLDSITPRTLLVTTN